MKSMSLKAFLSATKASFLNLDVAVKNSEKVEILKTFSNDVFISKSKDLKYGQRIEQQDHIEDNLIKYVKANYKLNIVKVPDINNPYYPNLMVLNTDKGILAYLRIFYYPNLLLCDYQNKSEVDAGHVYKNLYHLIKQLEVIDSDIDRPTFFLNWIDHDDFSGLLWESNDQVKQYLYEILEDGPITDLLDREHQRQDTYIHTPLNNMGELDELMYLILRMKKIGVILN